MFEINKFLLNKWGWVAFFSHPYSWPGVYFQTFPQDLDYNNYKFIIVINDILFLIKQNNKNQYNFVIKYAGERKDKQISFNSNLDLMKLIIKYEAFNEEYRRHIKINKILK